MVVRKVENKDYEKLVKLYSEFFTTHNVFQQKTKTVITYLKEQVAEHELLVNEENGEVKAGLFLVLQDGDENHKRWKFRHFAFFSEEAASELLEEAEKRVKEASETAKVELAIAETEEGIDFYKKHGYEQEGALKNHYRWGETTYILSKSFS